MAKPSASIGWPQAKATPGLRSVSAPCTATDVGCRMTTSRQFAGIAWQPIKGTSWGTTISPGNTRGAMAFLRTLPKLSACMDWQRSKDIPGPNSLSAQCTAMAVACPRMTLRPPGGIASLLIRSITPRSTGLVACTQEERAFPRIFAKQSDCMAWPRTRDTLPPRSASSRAIGSALNDVLRRRRPAMGLWM